MQMSKNAKSWLLSLALSHQAAGGSLHYHGRSQPSQPTLTGLYICPLPGCSPAVLSGVAACIVVFVAWLPTDSPCGSVFDPLRDFGSWHGPFKHMMKVSKQVKAVAWHVKGSQGKAKTIKERQGDATQVGR